MRKLIFIIPLLLILAQCTSPYKGEIAQLDSALLALDSAKQTLHNLDTGLIYQRYRQINENLLRLSSIDDTLTKEDAFLIDAYSSQFKAYTRWSGQIAPLYEEVEVVPSQIENLKIDLSKNLIDKEKTSEYVKNEIEMAKYVTASVYKMQLGTVKINQTYLDTEEKIILLIQRIKSDKQPES